MRRAGSGGSTSASTTTARGRSLCGYRDSDNVGDSGVVGRGSKALLIHACPIRVMPMSAVGCPGGSAGSCLRERSGENARSEEQDSKFDDSGKHLAEIVSCKIPTRMTWRLKIVVQKGVLLLERDNRPTGAIVKSVVQLSSKDAMNGTSECSGETGTSGPCSRNA